jgi:hypothetical protein
VIVWSKGSTGGGLEVELSGSSRSLNFGSKLVLTAD